MEIDSRQATIDERLIVSERANAEPGCQAQSTKRVGLSINPVRAAIHRTFDSSASQSVGAARSSGRCQNGRFTRGGGAPAPRRATRP
jgi:hypothetical protein